SWWHNSTRIIAPAMFISLLFGILDGIKASAFGDMLPAWSQRLNMDAFSKLEYDYENIKIIYRNDIDFSMYDKKLSEIYMENISKQE
ncbi:hypothetical protein MJM43_28330, partial [Salmonella enterica subsp. enterica serovar Montevideo]|nr:hypothetical protein [Salmonella enterica subsp. enterica serovar Montevideo]